MTQRPAQAYVGHHEPQASLRMYVTGFVLSISLTLAAYLLAIHHSWSPWVLTGSLLALALGQFAVQLFYFLHIGQETKPRWKGLLLLMMIVIVIIVLIGSIWVMYNLNYRMTPQQMRQYLQSQDGGV
jgi:cytochrome o ubiquinol oxidase operon protein cyoD